MVVIIKDTVLDQVQIFDDGTTLSDILRAIGYMEKEKERWTKNNKKRSSGKPVGRPKKIHTCRDLKDEN
jgi:hypothetical protein